MKTLIVVALAAFTTLAYATPERAEFEKRVGKYGTIDTNEPKALCACQDGVNDGRAGVLIRFQLAAQVMVACEVPVYNSVGVEVGGFECDKFVPLAK